MPSQPSPVMDFEETINTYLPLLNTGVALGPTSVAPVHLASPGVVPVGVASPARTSVGTNTLVFAQGSHTVLRPATGSRLEIHVTNNGGVPVWLGIGGVASPLHGVMLNPSGGAWSSLTFTGTVAAVATAGASAPVSISDIG